MSRTRATYLQSELDEHAFAQILNVSGKVDHILVDALKEEVEATKDVDVGFTELIIKLSQCLNLRQTSKLA